MWAIKALYVIYMNYVSYDGYASYASFVIYVSFVCYVSYFRNVRYVIYIQWWPKNSEIGRRLLELSSNFKKSDEHDTKLLCSVIRPILQN